MVSTVAGIPGCGGTLTLLGDQFQPVVKIDQRRGASSAPDERVAASREIGIVPQLPPRYAYARFGKMTVHEIGDTRERSRVRRPIRYYSPLCNIGDIWF
jgi:hypothetical protein